jgi:hypothetical protein
MKTYTTLYKGDTRALSIYARDQYDDDFLPTSASTYIKNSLDINIVNETQALVSGASITAMVDTVTTSAAGDYDIVWKLVKNGYIYHHVSSIKVVEL